MGLCQYRPKDPESSGDRETSEGNVGDGREEKWKGSKRAQEGTRGWELEWWSNPSIIEVHHEKGSSQI